MSSKPLETYNRLRKAVCIVAAIQLVSRPWTSKLSPAVSGVRLDATKTISTNYLKTNMRLKKLKEILCVLRIQLKQNQPAESTISQPGCKLFRGEAGDPFKLNGRNIQHQMRERTCKPTPPFDTSKESRLQDIGNEKKRNKKHTYKFPCFGKRLRVRNTSTVRQL